MKKLISTLMFISCLMMAIPSQAQIRFGIKGGMDISKLNVKIAENSTGFFVGPMVDFTLPIIGLGIDAAALYSHTSLKYKGASSEKLNSLEVPVNLKWTIGLGSTLGVFFNAGPQFGFCFNDALSHLGAQNSKKSFVSVNVGGGLKFLRNFQLGINYNFGASKLGDVIEQINDNGEMISGVRKNSWQVSLAYMF